MRLGEEAARTGKGNGEWSGAQAQYALAIALINAGRREAGRDSHGAGLRTTSSGPCSTGAACCRPAR